jgi:hypothetical protein
MGRGRFDADEELADGELVVSLTGDEDAAVGRELDELGERVGEPRRVGGGAELVRDALYVADERLAGQGFERRHAATLRRIGLSRNVPLSTRTTSPSSRLFSE